MRNIVHFSVINSMCYVFSNLSIGIKTLSLFIPFTIRILKKISEALGDVQ